MVSHGHGAMVQRLLQQIDATHGGRVARVVLTHNLPEPPPAAPEGGWSFELRVLDNTRPAGFGANHNRAFGHCDTSWYCLLNPDIELIDDAVWGRLLQAAAQPRAGCACPVLLNADGSVQDSQRAVVTPAALWRRHVLRRAEPRTDWVSAAFWLVPASLYRALGGFDESYHMYCEDTDFCLRLQLAGWRLVMADARALHPASRASRSNLRHFAWHVRSLLRLWFSPALRRYLALRG